LLLTPDFLIVPKSTVGPGLPRSGMHDEFDEIRRREIH